MFANRAACKMFCLEIAQDLQGRKNCWKSFEFQNCVKQLKGPNFIADFQNRIRNVNRSETTTSRESLGIGRQ